MFVPLFLYITGLIETRIDEEVCKQDCFNCPPLHFKH